MKNKIIFRKAKLKDLKEINNLEKKLSELHVEKNPNINCICKNYFSEDYIKNLNDKGLLVIAEDKNKIIGFANGKIINKGDDVKIKKHKIFYLDTIYVKKSYRKTNVGSKLHNLLLEHGKILKKNKLIQSIQCRIWSFNEASKTMVNKKNTKPLYTIYELS